MYESLWNPWSWRRFPINPYSYEDLAFAILDNIERKTNITFDEGKLDLILKNFSYDKLSDQLINLYKS